MTIIWGTNYAVIKSAFRELDPQAFNGLRMAVASAAFLAVLGAVQLAVRRPAGGDPPAGPIVSIFHTPARLTRADWLVLAGLGFVGHFLYQFLFIAGLAQTSVANSSLILAATPVLISLAAAGLGEERLGRAHWAGAALSAFGIYLVMGDGVSLRGAGLRGDLMMCAAVGCWTVYTLAARPLMRRHSPVAVTGLSMAIGTVLYLPVVWPAMRRVAWAAVSWWTLGLVVYSAVFALCVAYTIWYVGVRQIGSARTSVYSNVIPIVAMVAAVLFLEEPLGVRQVAGAAAVLTGVALTRARIARVPIPAGK